MEKFPEKRIAVIGDIILDSYVYGTVERVSPEAPIPIVKEEEIKKWKPDYVIILPWNIKNEIMNQLKYIKEWNGKFIIPIPRLEVI